MKKGRILVACVVVAVLLVMGWLLFRERATQPIAPLSSSIQAGSLEINIESVPYWLQNDPEWAAETIGGSNEPMAAVGCTVTCVAMALSAIGYQTNPLQLCRDLKDRNGFTDQGLLIWNKIEAVTNGGFRVEFPLLTHDSIEAALRKNSPVIAQIMLGGTVPHWVLIVGKEGSEYLIIDPLNTARRRIRLSDRSGEIHAIRVVSPT